MTISTVTIDPSVEHPDYCELEKKYDICEDAFEGCVKEYVPRLSKQTNAGYEAYVSRAPYYNQVEKTVTALCGALTRKPFVLKGYTEFPNTDDGNATTFLQENYRDLLLGARVSFLVDVGEDNKSRIIDFDADEIINWFGDGTQIGDFRMIEECQLVRDPQNPFTQIEIETYRELYIDKFNNYSVRRWSKGPNGKWASVDLTQLLVNGKPIKYIPLWVATPYDNSWEVYNPPLYTLATLNISHFRQSTDLYHYAHFMALPTFCIEGDLASYTAADGTVTQASVMIGSTEEALHLSTGSSASYVEVSGNSFTMLQNEIKATEERMFIAGSRLLTAKNGVESAAALAIRSGSETAVLDTIRNSLNSLINSALVLCGQIDNVSNPSIELNNDFTSTQLDPAYLKELLALYQAGTITIEQLTEQLYNNEVVNPMTTSTK